MKHFILAAALMSQSVSPAPAHAENLNAEFNASWASRATAYTAAVAAAETRQASAVAAFGNAARDKSPDVNSKMNDMFEAELAYGEAQGRKAALAEFMTFFARKPSAAASELWLQGQGSQLQIMARKGAADTEALKLKGPGLDGLSAPDYFLKALQVTAFNGLVRGAVEETQLIDQNLATYFQAKSEADTSRRRKRAALFGAIASGLSGMAQSPAPPPVHSYRCNTSGSSTTCSGQ